uniref:Uncharacterized protein n=1 Tax=Anguilla anguilla TaxID=7936 RepID=A0A0E9PTN1_ANGAN
MLNKLWPHILEDSSCIQSRNPTNLFDLSKCLCWEHENKNM